MKKYIDVITSPGELPYTINLKKQMYKEYVDKSTPIKTIELLITGIGIIFIIFTLLFIYNSFTGGNKNIVNATEIVDELYNERKYYGVSNNRDLERIKRVETCVRVGGLDKNREQILHCSTMNTLVTAIESNGMQSNFCKELNNCKGLKGFDNGVYRFLKFKDYYTENLYFAEKFWKYHHKKSLFTFVYGYKQNDGGYRYGWTATQKDTYLQFLKKNYDKVYNEIDKIYK